VRPIFVGEQPSGPVGPEGALAGQSGRRLARLAGVTMTEFLRHRRVNLLPRAGEWDPAAARRVAAELDYWLPTRIPFVLLGQRVALAFSSVGMTNEWDQLPSGRRVLRLPHPSGRNRAWNQPEVVATAEEQIRTALGDR
jgi:hypothetical protein